MILNKKEQNDKFLNKFLIVSRVGTMSAALYALAPKWALLTLNGLDYNYDEAYLTLIQHWGGMIFLVGLSMFSSVFYTKWRDSAICYSFWENYSWFTCSWVMLLTLILLCILIFYRLVLLMLLFVFTHLATGLNNIKQKKKSKTLKLKKKKDCIAVFFLFVILPKL